MTDQSRRTREVLRTTTARTCLPVDPDAVWTAIVSFAAVWNGRVVVHRPRELLVHTVGDDPGDPEGWLTWTVAALSPTDTRVQLVLAEQHDRTEAPELDLVLCHLAAHVLAGDRPPVTRSESS